MSGRAFIDTNILIYSVDECEPEKRDMARGRLKELEAAGSGVISTQVLQEFYVTVTKKLGVAPVNARGLVHALQRFEVIQITPGLVESAIDCSILSQLSLWDALVVVAAESANCDVLWTEDLNRGQIIRGVRVENPLLGPAPTA